ncbi:hypothetical protein Nepgr_024909 [Nepenthes gracilis]|uniref:Uncharacterized protein n=1 Tax=Nepenthes gracilis TaxID=150966 RepID=A0AAD3T5R4_NEPGR|nr:hypothetical protein Nepgr_024909 [Nepenthes gracilis]
MEGLIPFMYRAIVQYKNGGHDSVGSWFDDSRSSSYVRLSGGDSGRFRPSDISLPGSDYSFSFTASPRASTTGSSSSTARLIVAAGVQSPARFGARAAAYNDPQVTALH